MQFGIALTAAALALSAIMAAAWKVQRFTSNSGWIDAIWTFGIGIVGSALALAPLDGQQYPDWRQWVAAGFAVIWSLRLGLHIVGRTRANPDDPRYRAKLDGWGTKAASRLFWFLQAQAAVGLVLVAAIMLAAHAPADQLRWQDGLAIAFFAIGVSGEALADAQLRHFKRTSDSPKAVCDIGLWSWSRHPNYFCEWLCWCSFPLLAITGDYPLGWLALLAPLFMYWTLVYASGIPPLEEHMQRTRPEAFAAYKRQTSAFFPAPPRRNI